MAALTVGRSHHKKLCKHAKQMLEKAGIKDVREVYRVDTDSRAGDRIAYVTLGDKARTARFKKGPDGPVLDGVSFGWPVTDGDG